MNWTMELEPTQRTRTLDINCTHTYIRCILHTHTTYTL